MTTLPTEYNPTEVEHFFGPARAVAQRMVNAAKMCRPMQAPAAHLFVGPSGSGKSALAGFTISQFGVDKWNLTEVFGSDLSKERVQEIAMSMHLTSMFDGYRGFWFDEIDRCTKDARDRLLEIVGDRKQPKNSVIVATSNLSIEEFDALEKNIDAKGRFSSRFQIHEVEAPKFEHIVPLICNWLPAAEAEEIARNAATDSSGRQTQPINTRAVLKDVLTYMQR